MARGPRRIGEVLPELMARWGYARVQSAEALEAAWREAAGSMMARYTQPGALRRKTLEVVVANSPLMQELTFQKPALLKTLNELLPDEEIKDLRFRVGPVEPEKTA